MPPYGDAMQLRTVLATTTAALAAATCLTVAGPAAASAPAPVSHACSPSVTLDRFSDALDKTTYDGTFVGNLSALAVDRDGSLVALSDRSSLFALDARTLAPKSVVPLADENGAALDSEGLVIDRDGTRLVTSETEPSIRRYAQATAGSSTGSPSRPPSRWPRPAAPRRTRRSRA